MGGKLILDVTPTGRPSPAAAAVVSAITDLAYSPVATREGHLTRVRDCHHILAAAFRALTGAAAAAYYDPSSTRRAPLQDLADVADLSTTTMQGHLARGLAVLPPRLRGPATELRDARAAHRRGRTA